MVSTETILGKIVEKIVGTVFQSVGRHVGFLLHYKQNMKNLEDEVNNLLEKRSDVEGKVNEANRQGDAIDNKVSVWLEDAEKTRQEVEEFRDEKTVEENMLCFSFSCPNFISRYRLSKEAERKVVRVKHLTEKGGNIGTVSHPREDPPEVVFRSSGNYECFNSRDIVFKDIVKALKDPEVNMIGVYGTGGVGKTTMVTKVAEQVKKDGTFDEVLIAVVSHDANVIKIQGQLAERLNLILSEKSEVGRASRLWNRLDNGMKNLIILDDVWQELDLKEIDEVNNLQEQRSNIEGKVNDANRQGDAIDNKVSVWLEDAKKTRQEVEEFRDEKTVEENMLCFSFSCPNFISRYRLSKEAEKKEVRVKQLTEKGGNIGTVSHPRKILRKLYSDPAGIMSVSIQEINDRRDCLNSGDHIVQWQGAGVDDGFGVWIGDGDEEAEGEGEGVDVEEGEGVKWLALGKE
ncbi:hypothetical protein RHGRI_009975 [Rhododendron griersonianum]|uniref:NB-ARC domain-containing protein n=1 Tax=Rhododendron griersonianum TaxID=479676 RepID=A0AAV6KHE5_9ERIC|nr:hypothetical protein RHGRI_009975 [Rhododendron griersonianum]